MSCTSCGRPLERDARFCPNCGAAQGRAGEERRIITAMFADIVGFTALAERMDPEEVKHLVDRAFERLVDDITSFGGVVDKVLGDGIIALFGAPVAHEDDAERAVRAALRMQDTVQALSAVLDPPIQLRIGINTGEVLVGPTTAGGDYTAMGDVMNSASRLQGLAEPGETLADGATKAATDGAIAYRSAGRLPARGREQPIEAWVALHPVRPPGMHRERAIDSDFVGRDHEMALLEAQARLAVDGHRSQLAIVLGEAGIGKTRLVGEAAAYIGQELDARVLEGRCLPYGEANVWWPIAELVRDAFELSTEDSRDEAESMLRKALPEHLGELVDGDLDRYLTALLHALGYDTTLRGGDRNMNRSEVMLALTTVLEAALAEGPVVIVLSDMHWASDAVWALVNHILTELARQPLVVLMSARPGEEAHVPSGGHGLSVIRLGPLDDDAAASMLAQMGLDLAEDARDELVDRSGGNPFFLQELGGLMAKQGLGAAGADFDVDPHELPATLRGIIAARLDALDPGERLLLENAAVLGRSGTIDGLARMVELRDGVSEVSHDLASLVSKDLLELDGNRYRFRSNLVRDVAYGRLTKTARAQQHYGIAQYLEATSEAPVRNSRVVAIAEHYRAAAHLSAEVSNVPDIDRAECVARALYWLEQAGDRALEVGAPIQAESWYDSGVELAKDHESLPRFVFGRAKARTEIHDVTGARADLERLEAMPDLDPVVLAKAQLVRGDVDRKAGDLDSAAARLREAADRLSALAAPDQQSLALRLLGLTEMVRSHDSLARQAMESSRQVAMASGDRSSEAWALQALAWHTFRQGRVLEAGELVGEAIEIFTELNDRGGLTWSQGVEAWVAFHTGDWARARRLVDTVLPETRRRGDPPAEGIMLNLDASLELWSGRAQRALELARRARAVAERVDDITLAVQSRALEGRALVSLGRVDEGTETLEHAYSLADQADDSENRRIAVIVNSASAARLGEPERAIRWAARYDGMHDDPTVVGEADLVVSLALAMLQRGAVTEAATQLEWVDRSVGGAGRPLRRRGRGDRGRRRGSCGAVGAAHVPDAGRLLDLPRQGVGAAGPGRHSNPGR